MNMSDTESCSDCYLESIERKWNKVLLIWLNKCIAHREVEELNSKILINAISKYTSDVYCSDFDKLTLCSDDIEVFIKNKFPILRLGNIEQDENISKKLYILTSLLLYYLCTNSRGRVDTDICKKLPKDDQMMILKFCEALTDMEVTVNNIEMAIKAACETFIKQGKTNTVQETKPIVDLYPSSSISSDDVKRNPILKFKSSITVMPSVVTDTSLSRSSVERFTDESDYNVGYVKTNLDRENIGKEPINSNEQSVQKNGSNESHPNDSNHRCQPDCACTRCSTTGPCCGDPGCTKDLCDNAPKVTANKKKCVNWKSYIIIGSVTLLLLIIFLSTIPVWLKRNTYSLDDGSTLIEESKQENLDWAWICKNNFCQRVFHPTSNISVYSSLSRCTLLCTGLQLWPYPIGNIHHSNTIITVATKKLEYKFNSVPSVTVQDYLSEAFKLFLKDLARLERNDKSRNQNENIDVKKMNIQIDVESDPDPRLRLNTDEAYTLKVEINIDQVLIKISSESFCGVRHGLETLHQLFLLDQNTGHLITFSSIVIRDAPTYKYRGLMIDTARNLIPVIDLMRTIDAMSTCKLNTFHWRISDATSFPLYSENVPEFREHGPYDRSMVYTREDIKLLVKRAGVRGIRILIEVAAPGPVGRPWSWLPETKCSKSNDKNTCDDVLCLRLSMKEPVFDVLQKIYSEIIEMTKVDDVFHLSDGVFSVVNCNKLVEERDGFLDKALDRLKMANKGFLPRLPIIWYTPHLNKDFESRTWNRLGVQLNKWDPNSFKNNLSQFKVIHSSKWDLSCEMKNQRCIKYRSWQEIYAWKSWRNVDAFTVEGGEAILWTDIVDSSNLDYHLWPRAAAVAERLWSDMIANSTANKFVYVRLDTHSQRMLLRGMRVQPIWPAWCTVNPNPCLKKVY